MKKIIFLLLISNSVFAQIDSNQLKVTAVVQARDVYYMGWFISHKQEYEDVFDKAKEKTRIANAPSNLTNITVDTIPIFQWLFVVNVLRNDPVAIQGNVFSRVRQALLDANNTYLTKKINEGNSKDTAIYLQRIAAGKYSITRQ